MDCKSAGVAIQEYIDGEASDERVSEMEEHVAGCEQCRRYLLEMRALGTGLCSLDLLDPPEGFTKKVMAGITLIDARQSTVEGRNSLSFGWLSVLFAWARGAAVMAAVVLAFGLLSLFIRTGPTTARVFCTDPEAQVLVAGQKVTVPETLIIHGNLVVVDGNLTIAGIVEGDVRLIRGTVEKTPTGSVAGSIISLESPVAQAKDAVLGAIDWFVSMYNQAVRRMVVQ